MLNRFFHLTTVVLLASCFVLAQTRSESSNSAAARRAAEIGTGKWWIGLTDQAKDKFIERYTKAMEPRHERLGYGMLSGNAEST